jgi:hypothetical protein
MEVIQKIPGNHTVIPNDSVELMKLRNGKWKVFEVEKMENLSINNGLWMNLVEK